MHDPSKKKGIGTLLTERDQAERAERLERARLEAEERATHSKAQLDREKEHVAMWWKISLALIFAIFMIISGVLTVGATGKLPGGYELAINKSGE
jgi:hypothetical protein